MNEMTVLYDYLAVGHKVKQGSKLAELRLGPDIYVSRQ